MDNNEYIKKMTAELRLELLMGDLTPKPPEYKAVPENTESNENTWRVRLDPTFGAHQPIYLEINDTVTFGRLDDPTNSIIGLFSPEIGDQLGLSRAHAQLRLSPTKLFLVDQHSTNGSFVNGTRLTPEIPQDISSGDYIRLGRLEMIVSVVSRPMDTALLTRRLDVQKPDILEIIPQVARGISAHTDAEATVRQTMDFAAFYANAIGLTAWLVDDRTGTLQQVAIQEEASTDTQQARANRSIMQAAANFVSEVIRTSKPFFLRKSAAQPHLLASAPHVDTIFCMPLMVGNVAFGAIAGAHDGTQAPMDRTEEKLLETIIEFASITTHNNLQMRRVRQQLKRREKLITAFNYILAHDFHATLREAQSSATLMFNRNTTGLSKSAEELLDLMFQMSIMVDTMVETSTLAQHPSLNQVELDMLEMVTAVFEEVQSQAQTNNIRLKHSFSGEPYLLIGDETLLHRCIFKLVDNILRYCPRGTQADVKLNFGRDELLLYVRDNGQGFPADDLDAILDEYYRGARSVDEQLGLGLSFEFIRIVVEAHGGTFIVRNGADEGAECIISLPNNSQTTVSIEDTLPRNVLARVQKI